MPSQLEYVGQPQLAFPLPLPLNLWPTQKAKTWPSSANPARRVSRNTTVSVSTTHDSA